MRVFPLRCSTSKSCLPGQASATTVNGNSDDTAGPGEISTLPMEESDEPADRAGWPGSDDVRLALGVGRVWAAAAAADTTSVWLLCFSSSDALAAWSHISYSRRRAC